MALDSPQDHLSRNAIEMAQDLVQKYLAIQPVAAAITAWMGMAVAEVFVCRLVSPYFGHLPQEARKR